MLREQFLNPLLIYFKIDKEWSQFFLRWFMIGLFLHLITAIFSVGFLHFDEHWQILEFMNLKLGGTTASNLSWEYRYQMRSFSQPALYYFITKILNIVGMDNPFYLATVFRIFSSFIGWVSLAFFTFSLTELLNDNKKLIKIGAILLQLTWYIPFIQARPSSESFSTTMIILAFSLMILGLRKLRIENSFPTFLAIFIGIAFGFAFQFRFQVGFMILFSWIWFTFVPTISKPSLKIILKPSLLIAIFIVITISLELFIDYWGYQRWTIVSWNYLYQNLILNKQAGFATSPWWDFFRLALFRGYPPVSFILVFGQVALWIFKPKHPLTWLTFPLFIVHSAIAAKALRYIIPIVIFSPIAALIMLNHFKILESKNIIYRFFKNFIIYLNIILLLIATFRAANPAVKFYKFIYDRPEIKSLYYKNGNPFIMVTLKMVYYKRKNLKLIKNNDYQTIKSDSFYYFTDTGKDLINMLKLNKCSLEYSNYPTWSLKFNIGNWISRSRIWAVFHCNNSKK